MKFGETLTVTDCENLMESLAKCNLPFQCAHGRYTSSPSNFGNVFTENRDKCFKTAVLSGDAI